MFLGSVASPSAFRFCLSGRRRKSSPVHDEKLTVINAREQRRKVCPQDSSDRDLDYHRLCVNSSKNIISSVAQSTLSKFIFANDLPEGTHQFVTRPEDVNISNCKEFMIKTIDNELCHCYWLSSIDSEFKNNSEYVVLYLHGASGNIGHRLEVAKVIQQGLYADVLLIDYRGFGRSTGQPNELGTYFDAQAGFDWILANQVDIKKPIVVFGTSLGAAIAIHLSSQEDNARHIHTVIIENCFTSICEISRYYVPNWIRPLLDLIKSTSMCPLFDCLSKASRIRCAVLYIVGLRDHVVPSWMTQMLYSNTTNAERKAICEFPEGKHNDLPNFPTYTKAILNFLSDSNSPIVDAVDQLSLSSSSFGNNSIYSMDYENRINQDCNQSLPTDNISTTQADENCHSILADDEESPNCSDDYLRLHPSVAEASFVTKP